MNYSIYTGTCKPLFLIYRVILMRKKMKIKKLDSLSGLYQNSVDRS